MPIYSKYFMLIGLFNGVLMVAFPGGGQAITSSQNSLSNSKVELSVDELVRNFNLRKIDHKDFESFSLLVDREPLEHRGEIAGAVVRSILNELQSAERTNIDWDEWVLADHFLEALLVDEESRFRIISEIASRGFPASFDNLDQAVVWASDLLDCRLAGHEVKMQAVENSIDQFIQRENVYSLQGILDAISVLKKIDPSREIPVPQWVGDHLIEMAASIFAGHKKIEHKKLHDNYSVALRVASEFVRDEELSRQLLDPVLSLTNSCVCTETDFYECYKIASRVSPSLDELINTHLVPLDDPEWRINNMLRIMAHVARNEGRVVEFDQWLNLNSQDDDSGVFLSASSVSLTRLFLDDISGPRVIRPCRSVRLANIAENHAEELGGDAFLGFLQYRMLPHIASRDLNGNREMRKKYLSHVGWKNVTQDSRRQFWKSSWTKSRDLSVYRLPE